MKNIVSWFEIPVLELDRAIDFYQRVFAWDIVADRKHASPMGHIRLPEQEFVGSLIEAQDRAPSSQGSRLALNVGKDMARILAMVAKSGGRVLEEANEDDYGNAIALIEDTEGNFVQLRGQALSQTANIPSG